MEFWKTAYTEGWATLDQLKEAVLYGCITTDEFKEITGQDYVG